MPATLPSWTTVGFTGHRKLDDPRLIADAIRKVFDELSATHGLLAAISSAASGADTLFVEEVARRELPFFLILPFGEDRFRQDFSQADWDRVATHFGAALSIEEVRDVESPNEAYLECGVLTADRADVLLAVWNGEESAGKGGTGDIVAYARALEMPLIRIDSKSGVVSKERMERLPKDARAAAMSDATIEPRELVERQYKEFDTTAVATAPTARRLLMQIIWLHLLATAVGVTGSSLALPGRWGQAFTAIKFAALGMALLLAYRQRQSHHQWRDARVVAEICRSFLAFWPMRRRGARFPLIHAEKYASLLRNLQMIWYLDRSAERPLPDARGQYTTDRIQDQLNYFERKYKADGRRATRLKAIALGTTIAAFVTSGVALGLNLGDEFSTPAYTIALARWISNILGLIPPAILTLVIGLDLGRRATRFGDATDNLHEAERRVKLAQTWPGLWREVAATEEMLLREVLEWNSQSALKKKP